MKGVEPIMSHTLYLAIGLTALILVLTSVYNTNSEIGKAVSESQMEYVLEKVNSKISDFETSSDYFDYSSNEKYVLRKEKLGVPLMISDAPYTIMITKNEIIVEAYALGRRINMSKQIDVEMVQNSSASPGGFIQLEREIIDGEIVNTILLVN